MEWNDRFENEWIGKEGIETFLNLKGFTNYELVKGDICKTLDLYLEREPQTRIAMLHIDTDVYEPAKCALEKLFDRVVRGGIIILDDYAAIEGETKAVDEFFKGKDYMIKKCVFSHNKPSYIIK